MTPGPATTNRLSSRQGSSLSQEEREAIYRRLAAKREAAPTAEPVVTNVPFMRVTVQETPAVTETVAAVGSGSHGFAIAVGFLVLSVAAFVGWKFWPSAPKGAEAQASIRTLVDLEAGRGAFGRGWKPMAVSVGPATSEGDGYVFEVKAVFELEEALHRPAPAAGLINEFRLADRVRQLTPAGRGTGTSVRDEPPAMPPVFEVQHRPGLELRRTFRVTARSENGAWAYGVVRSSIPANTTTGLLRSELPENAVVSGTAAGDRTLASFVEDATRYVERRIAEREAELQSDQRPVVIAASPVSAPPATPAAVVPAVASATATVETRPAAFPRLERISFQQNVLFSAQ